MKASIRDLETLRAIQPLDVVAYLRAHRWQKAESLEKAAYWVKEDEASSYELLLPLDASLRDFPSRMAELLRTLEQAERRSQLEIVEDLSLSSADVVRPRLPGASHTGEISLEQGRVVYDQARNLMLAAACAAVEKRPLYAKRKPDQAMNFLKHAKFGMPKRGSYILTIISPVSPHIALGEDLLGSEPEEPFERRTMRTLAEALQTLALAALDVAMGSGIEPMRRAVQRGVSANLCEAIVGLHDGLGEKGVEFAFSWAPLREVPASVPRFAAITPDFVSIIRETARVFRETEVTDGIEVIGVVNDLKHRGGDQGRVTVIGTADGVARKVTLDLAGGNHALAVRSYEERIRLSCIGELVREGRSWVLRNPREISLLEDDASNDGTPAQFDLLSR